MRVNKIPKGTYYNVNSTYYSSASRMKKGILICLFTSLSTIALKILFGSINDTFISSTSDLLSGNSMNFFANLKMNLASNEVVSILIEIVNVIVQFIISLFILIVSLVNSAKLYLGIINKGVSL